LGGSRNSVGGIAIAVLNVGLRPFLSTWHPAPLAWESAREPGASPLEHQRRWPEGSKLRVELEACEQELGIYANALAVIAGLEPY
jgi:hypothetical protein